MAESEGPKKKQKKAAAGAPLWMVTYSDMVTLLLTFFVLLLSMATLDNIKFHEAIGSLQGAFGVLRSTDKTSIEAPRIIEYIPVQDDYTARVYQRIITDLQRLKIDRDITLVKDRGAVVLRVDSSILFGPGETALRAEAEPILRNVAALVASLPLQIRVEGHTDSVPVTRHGASNWDLSVMRAVSVVKFFAQERLLPLDRLSAAGYGEERPLASNETEEGRAQNRRVEFVLESSGGANRELPHLIDARDQLPF